MNTLLKNIIMVLLLIVQELEKSISSPISNSSPDSDFLFNRWINFSFSRSKLSKKYSPKVAALNIRFTNLRFFLHLFTENKQILDF